MISQFPVFRNPSQLLRFLGLSGPDAPDRVNDGIQGSMDLLPWWLAASEQNLSVIVTPGVGALGLQTAAATIVPKDQRWIITSFSITTATLPVAHTYRITPGVFLGGLQALVFGVGQAASAIAGEQIIVDAFEGKARGSWLLLQPFDNVGAFINNNVGATPAVVTLNIRFTTFPN